MDLLFRQLVLLLEPLKILRLVLLQRTGHHRVLNDLEHMFCLLRQLLVFGLHFARTLGDLLRLSLTRVCLFIKLQRIVGHIGLLAHFILRFDNVLGIKEIQGAQVREERKNQMRI